MTGEKLLIYTDNDDINAEIFVKIKENSNINFEHSGIHVELIGSISKLFN